MDPFRLTYALVLTAAAGCLFLWLPGYAAARALVPRELDSFADALALPTLLGVGITAVPATLLLILHGSLDTLVVILAATSLAALWITVRYTAPRRHEPRSLPEPRALRVIVVVGVTFLVGLAARTATVRADTGDHWVYLAFIKSFLASSHLEVQGTLTPFQDARMAFSGWLVLESVLARVTGLAPETIHCITLPCLLTIVAVGGFFALARRVDPRPGFASLAIVVQLTLWLSTLRLTAAERDPGFSLLARAAEDKILCWQVLLPPALAIALALARGGAWISIKRYGGAIVLSVAALALSHPIGPVLFALSVGSLLAGLHIRSLLGRSGDVRIPALLALTIVVCGLGVSLAGRRAMQEAGFERQFSRAEALENVQALEARFLSVSESGTYRASLDLLEPPMVFAAALSVPFLLIGARSSLGALFLLTNMVVPAVALYLPFLATELGRWMTPYQIYRLHWIWPVGLCVTWVLFNTASIMARRWGSPTPASALAVLWLLVSLVFLRDDLRVGLYSVQGVHDHGSLEGTERELLTAVGEHARRGEVVLAPAIMSVHIPAFAPRVRVLVHREWQASSTARHDLAEWYGRGKLDGRAMTLLARYGVRLVVLERGSELGERASVNGACFRPLFENRRFTLYRVLRARPDTGGPWPAADRAKSSGLVDEAKELYRTAIDRWPSLIWPRLHLASLHLGSALSTDSEAAVRAHSDELDLLLSHAMTAGSEHPAVLELIVRGCSVLGDCTSNRMLERFISDFEARFENPAYGYNAHEILAHANRAAGETDRALALLRSTVARWPRWGPSRVRLAEELLANEMGSEALDHLERAVASDPSLERAHARLAELYRCLGRDEDVETLLTRARRWNARRGWPRALLAKHELAHGRTDDAIDMLEDAVLIEPNGSSLYELLDSAYAAEGRWNRAVSHYTRVRRRAPGLLEPVRALSEAYLQSGEAARTVRVLEELFEAGGPRTRVLSRLLESALRSLGAGDDRLAEVYELAGEGNPNRIWPWIELARVWRDGGRFDAAEAALGRGVKTVDGGRDRAAVEAARGDLSKSRGELERAVDHYRLAVTLHPEAPGIWRLREALHALRRAM